jgi:hypothetical protein
MPILLAALVIGAIIWAIEASGSANGSSPAQNAQTMNQLLLAIHDPNWAQKVQQSLMNDGDALGLDVQAATIGVAELAAAQAIRIKVAALNGQKTYSPPPLPAAVDDPSVYDLFPTGQYQGCDANPQCDPSQARYGSGPGPLGLDAGISSLDVDAQDCVSYLLQCYPDSWAKEWPLAANVQGDPTGTLLQAINGVENVVRSSLPMLATALRYKAAFLLHNKSALNTAALAAVQSGVPMTSFQGSTPVGLHGPGFGPPGSSSSGPSGPGFGPPGSVPSGGGDGGGGGGGSWFPPGPPSGQSQYVPPPPSQSHYVPPASPSGQSQYVPPTPPTPAHQVPNPNQHPVPTGVNPIFVNHPLQPLQPSQPSQPAQTPPVGDIVTASGGVLRDRAGYVRTHLGATALVHMKPRWIGSRVHVVGMWIPPVWPGAAVDWARRVATAKHIHLP